MENECSQVAQLRQRLFQLYNLLKYSDYNFTRGNYCNKNGRLVVRIWVTIIV